MKNALALPAAAVGLLIGSGLAAAPAEAAFVLDLTQVADKSQPLGFDVVATGSGTIDLTGLTLYTLSATTHGFAIAPNHAVIVIGPPKHCHRSVHW